MNQALEFLSSNWFSLLLLAGAVLLLGGLALISGAQGGPLSRPVLH